MPTSTFDKVSKNVYLVLRPLPPLSISIIKAVLSQLKKEKTFNSLYKTGAQAGELSYLITLGERLLNTAYYDTKYGLSTFLDRYSLYSKKDGLLFRDDNIYKEWEMVIGEASLERDADILYFFTKLSDFISPTGERLGK